MVIIRQDLAFIAIIDPKKKHKEDGQYVLYKGADPDRFKIIAAAKEAKKEIRYYYKELATSNGEKIPCQIIITEIPPKHVQPFHTHLSIHEINVVNEGSVMAIDSPISKEDDPAIFTQGIILNEGDGVTEDTGKRHTIANHTDQYAIFTTTQVARMDIEQFPADWKR